MVFELLPRELLKPRMILQFLSSVKTESFLMLSGQKLIAEDKSLIGPLGHANMRPFQFELFFTQKLSGLGSRPDPIGPLTNYTLIHDNPKGIEVHLEGVVLSHENLGSHIGGRSRRVALIVEFPRLGDSKVSQLGIAWLVKDDIFRLDVSMDDSIKVDML